MKTKSIGEILRAEREHRQLSLADLSQRTRIRLQYLEALENNEFENLPAATFVKGYIRTYGQMFGFDYKPLLAMLRRDYKESAKGTLVPREFIKPVMRRRRLWTPITSVVIALVVVIIIVGAYIGIQWYSLQQPPVLEITSPEIGQEVAPQVEVSGQTVPEAIVTVNEQPVALQIDGSFSTVITLPREGIHTITVSASNRQGKANVQKRTVRVAF